MRLAGARMALATAGIEAEVEHVPVTFAPDVEAVLAWAVREGATNVNRHSQARRCLARVSAHLGSAEVEVIDDGPGGSGGGTAGSDRVPGTGDGADLGQGYRGHGLAGLAGRAQSVRGRMEAGPVAGGGFGSPCPCRPSVTSGDPGPGRRGSRHGPRRPGQPARP